MIIDRLGNLEKYVNLHPLFAEAFEYVQNHDLLWAQTGKTELQENRLSVTVAQTIPRTKEKVKLEAHRAFIDVQIPLTGVEVMGYSPVDCCHQIMTPYDPEKDILFFQDVPQTYLTVEPGMFVIFFPQDAHAPGITSCGIKKTILKVKA